MIFLLSASLAQSALQLSPVFSDNMVLQRDRPLPVWGTATPGEKVSVQFLDQKRETTADDTGSWCIVLKPEPTNCTPSEMHVIGSTSFTVKNVVVGDVWLCSGQSNMEMRLKFTTEFEAERSTADFPLIRQLKIANNASETPQNTFDGGWQECTPQTAGEFSAVAYHFARAMQKKTRVPIGLINSSWGGTTIEAWLDESSARNGFAEYQLGINRWKKEKKSEKKFRPSAIHNAMVHPLYPAAIQGVVWYQGESNVWWPDDYFAMFKEMIRGWREGFQQPNLPFVFVQLPGFADKRDPTGLAWARLREQQFKAASLPGVKMVVTIDLEEPDRIHPNSTKDEIGKRLADTALAWEPSTPDFGPCLDGTTIEGSSLKLHSKSPGRLLLKRSSGFEVAGEDRVFRPAEVRLEGATLIITSPFVPNPIAIRYAWTNAPKASLYSATGLPLSPFRSDTWPF